MNNEKLTGNTRYRHSWLGKLILQVECQIDTCDRTRIEPVFDTKFHWRDAKVTDMHCLLNQSK